MATYAGVDLGATNVRAVVGDERGEVIASNSIPTPQGPNGIAITEDILQVLRDTCADAGVDPKSISAAGIASFGPLDLAEGVVTDPANLPDTIDTIPLTGPISKLIGSDEVYLHNDTTAGVIGERFYSERNPDDMVYLTISSGIGAGVAIDGNIIGGWDGNAGEVGHMTLDPTGLLPCGCGIDGHWEAYCSGNNIPWYAAHLHDRDPVETDLAFDDPDFAAVDVYAPLVIYVGGAVTLNNPEWILDPIESQLEDMVMSNVPDLQKTTLGADVVVKGALASALTNGTGDRALAPR